jgi:hypothetical protein
LPQSLALAGSPTVSQTVSWMGRPPMPDLCSLSHFTVAAAMGGSSLASATGFAPSEIRPIFTGAPVAVASGPSTPV